MNRILFVGFVAITLYPFNLSNAKAQGETEIPLSTIDAIEMPGTKNLWKIDDKTVVKELSEIHRELSEPRQKGKDAGTAFVVPGANVEAVHEAHEVLVKGKKARSSLQRGSDASLIFFSYEFPQYVQLDSVKRKGNTFDVRYRFVPHKSKELTAHLAVIPIGKLDRGQFELQVTQLPTDQKFSLWKPVSTEDVKHTVCKSFSFIAE